MRDAPQWLIDLLGPSAADALQLIPEALQAAHQRASNTQEVSGLRQQYAYGSTSWIVVCEELVAALGSLPGARRFRPKGATYELVVLNGTAICPCRVSRNGERLERAQLKATRVRRALSSLHQRTTADVTLDLAAIDYDEDQLFDPAVVIPKGSASRVVFVPFDVDPKIGLLAAGIGEGLMRPDGSVTWSEFHELRLDQYRAGPQPLPATDEMRFDNASMPEPPLSPRAQPVENPEAQDTESGTPGRSVENGTDD